MPRSIYTKLTRRHRTLGGYTQLWLAPDHLLLLTSTRLAEQYQRFAFTDIQSIVVTRTPSRLVFETVMILAALAWMLLWFAVDSAFARWTFEITGGLALLWSIVDIARGPRCRCVLQTRVSKERLAPVSRLKIAHDFLGIVRPMVEAVQGALPAEQAIETPAEVYEPAPSEIASPPGYLPEILFITFLINAALIWSLTRFPNIPEIPAALMNTGIAEVVLIIVALLRRKGRDARVVVYVLVVLSIIGIAFDVATAGSGLTAWYMKVLEKAKIGEKTITPLAIFPTSGIRVTIAWGWRAVTGALGLAAAFYERREK